MFAPVSTLPRVRDDDRRRARRSVAGGRHDVGTGLACVPGRGGVGRHRGSDVDRMVRASSDRGGARRLARPRSLWAAWCAWSQMPQAAGSVRARRLARFGIRRFRTSSCTTFSPERLRSAAPPSMTPSRSSARRAARLLVLEHLLATEPMPKDHARTRRAAGIPRPLPRRTRAV